MRAHRLAAAKEQLPQLGAMLNAQDEASGQYEDSLCAALYLLRYKVRQFGRDKLSLHTFQSRQVEPQQQLVQAIGIGQHLAANAGELSVDHLPSKPVVRWKGNELYRYTGFKIGDKSAGKNGSITDSTFADVNQSFSVDITTGIITKISLEGTAAGRMGSATNWQCQYWLFPEGGYVALKGFSLENTDDYLGGGLSLAIWEIERQPQQIHAPTWERPWWLHQIGGQSFTAVHLFSDVPLTSGFGNNPFNASAPNSFQVLSSEKTKGRGDGILELNWNYDLTDKRIYRLFHPRLDNDGSYDLADVTDLRESLLTNGKLTKVPHKAVGKDGQLLWPPERVSAFEEALKYVKWRPHMDWLYRQYLVGVGENSVEAEYGARQIIGAAWGWIDRPVDENELQQLIVAASISKSANTALMHYHQAWALLPAALTSSDSDSIRKILRDCPDPIEMSADAKRRIEKCIDGGVSVVDGTTKDGGEGWMHNPAYAAVDVPTALRFMDHFELFEFAEHSRLEHRKALLDWADFSLRSLGGHPLDWEKLRTSYHSVWSNRIVMLVPLMLRAYAETNDNKYARASRLLFDEVLMDQVEKNPHGYFWAWGCEPQKAEPYDTNYNMAAYDRGIVDFWSEDQLAVIGAENASRFLTAQARYLVSSGQFLDTLETDSMTAVQSHFPGGIPSGIGHLAPLLYDDFAFYRGICADMIRWAAIDDGGTVERREGRRNLYTLKIGSRGLVFWAYGVGQN
jgi:hypothetical protein